FNRRQKLFETRQYSEVTAQAAEFLEQMRGRYGEDSKPFELAENMIISAHVFSNRTPDAVPYLEHKLGRRQASGSQNDLEFTLYNLGRAYNEVGRFSEAEPLHLRVLAMFEKTPTRENLGRIRNTLGGLANTYSGLGRLEDSKRVLERELAYA